MRPPPRRRLVTSVMLTAAGCSKKSTLAAPLIDAARDGDVAKCEHMVKRGSRVNETDDHGDTALSRAVFYCKADVVRKLIELGADVNHVDERGMTPLMYTATTLRGHSVRGTHPDRNELARPLIEHGADLNHAMGDGRASGDGQSTLHFAAKDKNVGPRPHSPRRRRQPKREGNPRLDAARHRQVLGLRPE